MLGGQRDLDPVGQLEAQLLAHRVERVDQVEHPALELAARRRASCRARPSRRPRTRPPSPRGRDRSTSTSSAARSCPAARKPPSGSSSNSPAASAARTAPSSLPSFGPSTGRFGFTRSSVASTRPNSTSLTRSSSRISPACACASGAPSTTSRAQRLAQLQAATRDAPDGRARRPAAPRPSPRAARRPAPRRPQASRRGRRESGAPSRRRARARCQSSSARNGITGETTRSAWTSAYQSVRKRRLVERVEAPARAADVPVREVVDEPLERRDRHRASRTARTRRVASSTSCCVRARSQRSSGRSSPDGPASRSVHVGRKPSMLA